MKLFQNLKLLQHHLYINNGPNDCMCNVKGEDHRDETINNHKYSIFFRFNCPQHCCWTRDNIREDTNHLWIQKSFMPEMTVVWYISRFSPPKSQSCASSQLNWQTYCIYLSYLKGTGQEDIMLKHRITHHKAIKLKKPLKLYFCLVLLAQNSKCPCTLPRWLTSGKTCLEGHWLFLRIVN